ncbi:MAG TPA: serine hydrolase, partial [Parafilimonas sp.]|nr:serine hydrolase [Parafilimonas sp.]
HPLNAQLTALINKYTAKGLPGIALLVTDKNGTWVGSAGKADIEHNKLFTVNQVSKIASIHKLFLGTLMFKLFEDSVHTGIGYNALQQPIRTWLPPDITDHLANGDIITLGQLMKHESGIPDFIEMDNFYLDVLNMPQKQWAPEDIIKYVYDKPAVFTPGDTAIYSNTNIILEAMIIDRAIGVDHAILLHEKILEPLGLSNTFYFPYDDLPNSIAQGYFDLYNNNTILNVSNLLPGGMYSNIFDLNTFLKALLVDKTLLCEKSLSIMQTFGKPDPPNRYGYGIMQKFIERGINAGIGHSGRDLGYSANLFYFPNTGVLHAFVVNYGTDAESNLRQVFYDFQNELMDLTLH